MECLSQEERPDIVEGGHMTHNGVGHRFLAFFTVFLLEVGQARAATATSICLAAPKEGLAAWG